MGSDLAVLIDAVEQSSVDLADKLLRESGTVCPPTAHFLSKHTDPLYMGSIAARRFRRGSDAADAVTALGVLPSVLHATRLVVVWEYADLCMALETSGSGVPNGLVVLDASMSTHTVRWHPCLLRPGPVRPDGAPTARPEWGAAVTHPGGALPGPVEQLLEVWREWRRDDVRQTSIELEAAGYLITSAATVAHPR